MKNIKKQKILAISLVVFLNFFAFYLTFAWTEPSASPPGNNVPLPTFQSVTDEGNTTTNSIGVGATSIDPNYMITTSGGGIKAENNDSSNPAGYFSNAGTGPGLVVNSGNVGIGTTSPGAALEITNTSSPQLILGGAANQGVNASGYKLYISGYDNDDTNYTYPIYVKDENGGVDFWLRSRSTQSGNSAAYFQGNVGIGTTSPASKLDVSGDIHATGDICTDQGGGICLSTAGGGTGDITAVYAGMGLTGGGETGDVALDFDITGISSCTDSTTSKIIWDSTNNRLTCATDQTGGATGCTDVIRTISADSGSKTASGCSDSLTIAGGSGISTSISGSTLTITNTGVLNEEDTFQSVTDRGNTTTNSIGVGTTSIDPNYMITTSGGGIKAENNDSSNPAGYFSNAGTGPGLVVNSGMRVDSGKVYISGSTYLGTSGGSKVGIGTTTPGYTLDVRGVIRGTSYAYFADDSGEKVGIGTYNPSSKLDVSGDINSSGIYRVGGTAGVSSTCPAGQTFSGITTSGGIVTSTGSCVDINGGGGGIGGSISTGQVAFGTGTNTIGGDDALYWDNTNKRLGIGTTSPGQKLSIHGSMEVPYGFDIYIYGSYSYKNFLQSGWDGSNSADYVKLYAPGNQNSNPVMTLWSKTSGNKVGIGTTTPGYTLDVRGAIRGTSYAYFADDSGEKVGIGTYSPSSKLDVSGDIHATGDICTDQGGGICLSTAGGGGSLWTDQGTYVYPNNYTNFAITDTGYLGIGTTSPDSNYKITTSGGGIKAENNDSSNPAGYFSNAGTGGSGLIVNSGKVGIGVTSPTYHLEVYDSSYGGFFVNDKNTGNVVLGYKSSSNYYHDLKLGELSSFFTGNLGVGKESPGPELYIYGGTGGGSTPASADLLTIENSASTYLNIITGTSNYGGILFSDDARAQGGIFYNHSTDKLIFKTGGTSNRFIVDSNGISIGADSTSDDDYIYFDGGNADIYWDDSASRFQTSHALSVGDYIVTNSYVSANNFYGGSFDGTTGTFSGQVYSNGSNDANKVCQKNGYNCPDVTTYITSAYVTVSKNGASNSVYSPACPTGYAMTGGGCGFNALGTNIYLNSSYPNSSRGEWYCSGINGSSADLKLTAYIVCSKVKQ